MPRPMVKKMTRLPVLLGLGSNLCYKNISSIELLQLATSDLKKILDDTLVSKIFQTSPMYYIDQPNFFNMAVLGYKTVNDTILFANNLLSEIHKIEEKYGRDRSRELRNGPRTLDIDIEAIGNLKISQSNLVIPHPRLFERAFVLEPLLDILQNLNSEAARVYKNDVENLILSIKK